MKKRKLFNTTIEEELLKAVKFLALEKEKRVNDFIEEGLEYILKKYGKKIPK